MLKSASRPYVFVNGPRLLSDSSMLEMVLIRAWPRSGVTTLTLMMSFSLLRTVTSSL